MFALQELVRYLNTLQEKEQELSVKELNYFRALLNHKMRDYANQDIRIQRNNKKENVYISMIPADNPMIQEDGTYEDVIDNATNENNLFGDRNFEYLSNPYIEILTWDLSEVLTSYQFNILNVLLQNNMDIAVTAKQLNRTWDNVKRSFKEIKKRVEQEYCRRNREKVNYTRTYVSLLKEREKIEGFISKIEKIELLSEHLDCIYNFIAENENEKFMDTIMMDKLSIYNGKLSYHQTKEFINELNKYIDFIDNYPYKYANKTVQSSYGANHNKEVKRREQEGSRNSIAKVYDAEGNLLREETPVEKKYNTRYVKLDINGVEIE